MVLLATQVGIPHRIQQCRNRPTTLRDLSRQTLLGVAPSTILRPSKLSHKYPKENIPALVLSSTKCLRIILAALTFEVGLAWPGTVGPQRSSRNKKAETTTPTRKARIARPTLGRKRHKPIKR